MTSKKQLSDLTKSITELAKEIKLERETVKVGDQQDAATKGFLVKMKQLSL